MPDEQTIVVGCQDEKDKTPRREAGTVSCYFCEIEVFDVNRRTQADDPPVEMSRLPEGWRVFKSRIWAKSKSKIGEIFCASLWLPWSASTLPSQVLGCLRHAA